MYIVRQQKMEKQKVIAIDFDGTIVEDRYPEIGKPKMFAFQTLKALQQKGFLLILWTCREGKSLDAAVDLCKANGVEFYAVNENYPGESKDGVVIRKLTADLFIDDRNFGGLPGWGEIYQFLCPEDGSNVNISSKNEQKGLWQKLFK